MSTDTAAALGGMFILAGFLIALAGLAFCVWAAVDVLRRPAHQWAAAGQNQVIWLVVVFGSWLIGVPFIGALLYWFVARRALRATQRPTLAS